MKATPTTLTTTVMTIALLCLFTHSNSFAQMLADAGLTVHDPSVSESEAPPPPSSLELRTITFEAKDAVSGALVTLDSIRIMGGGTSVSLDTVLVGASELVIDITTGIDAIPRDGGFRLSGNFSNPFTEQTQFAVFTPASSQALISLYDLNGRRVASSRVSIDPGSSRFVIHGAGLPAGIYLLEVRDEKGARKTSKVVKAGSSGSGSARIEYAGTISDLDHSFGKITEQLNLQVTGFSERYQAKTLDVRVSADTTITFVLDRAPEAPVITAFSATPTSVYAGDTVHFMVSCTDWDADLKTVSVDIEDNGSFDESYPLSGDEADLTVGIPFPTAGSYKSRVLVEDNKGHKTEAVIASAIIVQQKPVYTEPFFVSLSLDRSSATLEDTVTFSVVVRDWDADLKQLLIDYQGDTVWDDSLDISGNEHSTSFSHIYTKEGMYSPYLRVIDSQGLQSDTILYNAIAISGAIHKIYSISGQITGTDVVLSGIKVQTGTRTVLSDSIGNYKVDSLSSGVYFITPGNSGTVFAPRYTIVTIIDHDIVNIDFTAYESKLFLPALTTKIVTDISSSSAVSGGNIISDKGYAITQKGVCWSTTPDPSINDNITNNGSGNSNYSSSLSELNNNTVYFARSYAINSIGIGYGDVISFRTSDSMVVLIPAGTFKMGNLSGHPCGWAAELPTHDVTITSPFYIRRTEVTQIEYIAITGDNPSSHISDFYPVNQVSWLDAIRFCNTLSIKEGFDTCYSENSGIIICDFYADGYRLPTEAEWEYACRAGTSSDFHTGDMTYCQTSPLDSSLNLSGWYGGNSNSTLHHVGSKEPNTYGIYDMHGNVAEWCWDWYGQTYYSSSPTIDPTGAIMGKWRVCRGGFFGDKAFACRSAWRGFLPPLERPTNCGIRLVRTKR